MARTEARRILGSVAKGADPAGQKQDARKAATVTNLCDDYLEAAVAGRILTRRKTTKRRARNGIAHDWLARCDLFLRRPARTEKRQSCSRSRAPC
jgi:hypothetical protein